MSDWIEKLQRQDPPRDNIARAYLKRHLEPWRGYTVLESDDEGPTLVRVGSSDSFIFWKRARRDKRDWLFEELAGD